ncbi:MAG TPA: ABC transporter ATP-binding protein, partial [Steroidobacteraceae bacterium]
MSEAIVDVKGLTVEFSGPPPVRAVGGVDLTLAPGEVLAFLGESGSGKSVTLRALMRLLPKRAAIGGTIRVDGRDVRQMGAAELSAYRGSTVAMVFQEPGLALDPVYSVGDQIAEAVVRHEGASRAQGRRRALELFERVRIPSAARRLDNYPHEMSGGMRQRAMIALALSCRPKVLLADEPTTALDATVQIQVLLLLRELQRELGL